MLGYRGKALMSPCPARLPLASSPCHLRACRPLPSVPAHATPPESPPVLINRLLGTPLWGGRSPVFLASSETSLTLGSQEHVLFQCSQFGCLRQGLLVRSKKTWNKAFPEGPKPGFAQQKTPCIPLTFYRPHHPAGHIWALRSKLVRRNFEKGLAAALCGR